MLDHIRQKIIQALSQDQSVLLSSCGPADIQTSRLPCALWASKPGEAPAFLILYLLVPRASEHLLNLEHRPSVVVLGKDWELHGTAQIQCAGQVPDGLPLLALPQATWGRLVVVRPTRLHLHRGTPETIDLMDASENQ